jgi:uncharacterized protein YbjQ (UPF0145 family)
VSVFSVGLAGGVKAMFKSFVRGEVKELTCLIYRARIKALSMIEEDAAGCGAKDVAGVLPKYGTVFVNVSASLLMTAGSDSWRRSDDLKTLIHTRINRCSRRAVTVRKC